MLDKLRTLSAILVLTGVFGASVWHVLTRQQARAESGRVVLRIGHWLLQAGMRESFDEAAAAYQALHPNVRVEQVTVPIRMWPSWLRTQLIGGTAPDLMGLRNANEEIIARYFVPITDSLAEPNPYNDGTPLEGVPWQETFIDGLDSMRNLTPTAGEVSSVLLLLNTTRLFYNRPLLRTITGSDKAPEDFAALLALGKQVEDYNQRTGNRLVPIAACGVYSEYLFASLMPSQTQKLARELSPLQTLVLKQPEMASMMLDKRIGYATTPELRSSLELLRDVSGLMTPGFNQLQRDDALFAFMQKNALMIFAGSWDYTVMANDAGFEIGICPLPLPSTEDPHFGKFMAGRSAESIGSPDAVFGIVRTSPNREIALDFLRFLSSWRIARIFTANTYRMSAVMEIEPPAHAAGLAPVREGEINGFRPDFSANFGGGNAYNVFQRNLYLLLGARGNPDEFAGRLDEEMPAALQADLIRYTSNLRRNTRQLDARLGLLLSQPESESGGGGEGIGCVWQRFGMNCSRSFSAPGHMQSKVEKQKSNRSGAHNFTAGRPLRSLRAHR